MRVFYLSTAICLYKRNAMPGEQLGNKSKIEELKSFYIFNSPIFILLI